MKKVVILGAMGVFGFTAVAQISIEPVQRPTIPSKPYATYPSRPPATSQPGQWQIRPTLPNRPAPNVGILPVPSQNNRYPQYQQRPTTMPNYNNGYSNQRPAYGNNGGYTIPNQGYNNRPGIGGWPSSPGTTTGVAPIIPWWYTGQFNTALPHIRQQRPTPQRPANGWNGNYGNNGGFNNTNGYLQPQYNQPYNNYSRPQSGYPYQQRPNYNNGYQRGQQYNRTQQYRQQNWNYQRGYQR